MQSKKPPGKQAPRRPQVEARGFAREPKLDTERVFGLAAARAVLRQRPEDVRQIAHTADVRQVVAELLREAAKRRIAYREVPREELERIAGSLHHEGICLQVVPRRTLTATVLAKSLKPQQFVLALDGVDNPHNIGALLRSAGFFGAHALLIAKERETRLSSAAVRVAEGAAEVVPVCFVQELGEALDRLRAEGAHVFGADAHGGQAHTEVSWPDKTVLVLGSERLGLTAPVKKRCHGFVHIKGAQSVESLNVSVAAGILMATVFCSRAEPPASTFSSRTRSQS